MSSHLAPNKIMYLLNLVFTFTVISHIISLSIPQLISLPTTLTYACFIQLIVIIVANQYCTRLLGSEEFKTEIKIDKHGTLP